MYLYGQFASIRTLFGVNIIMTQYFIYQMGVCYLMQIKLGALEIKKVENDCRGYVSRATGSAKYIKSE